MNYFITRDGQQYGPYTLADLQRYVASGEILLTDLARSEGMSEPLPVSQIVGTIAVPQAQISTSPVFNAAIYPDPPTCIGGWCCCSAYSAVGFSARHGTWCRRLG
jgi:hypothetical protein